MHKFILIWGLCFISIFLDWCLGFERALQSKSWILRALQNETHTRASILNTGNTTRALDELCAKIFPGKRVGVLGRRVKSIGARSSTALSRCLGRKGQEEETEQMASTRWRRQLMVVCHGGFGRFKYYQHRERASTTLGNGSFCNWSHPPARTNFLLSAVCSYAFVALRCGPLLGENRRLVS